MSKILERLESLEKSIRKPKQNRAVPPPVVNTNWQKLFKDSETKRHALLNANKTLVANEKRYERLADFILSRTEELQAEPLADVTHVRDDVDNTVILDLTDGNPKKYFALLSNSGVPVVKVYLATVPDKMTKHHLAQKYHAYFSGSESEQKAFRVIRSLKTGNPILTPKSGKRIFWVCADAATFWKCTCLAQLEKTERNQTAAAEKKAAETTANDAVASRHLQELQALYGSIVEPAAVEEETPPAAFTAFDPTRGTEVEFKAARRTARMCTNRGEKWSGYSGRGIPYSKMIQRGLDIGFTLEQMSQVEQSG